MKNLQKVDKGHGLTAEEERWAVKQAFRNRDTLAFSKKELGLCNQVVFDMKLSNPEQKPISQKPYNHSGDDLAFLKKEVETLLDADLVEETSSPWA